MIVGMMRVKNEDRWIERSISSLLPVCDRILVMDDHSTDSTAEIAAAFPTVCVIRSPFDFLDETRDKNALLAMSMVYRPEWIVCIDGDEMLSPSSVPILKEAMQSQVRSISMRIPYLWDREDQIRVDGVYGEFRRHSAFRPGKHRFTSTTAGGFHCGNVPRGEMDGAVTVDAIQLLHFGYMHAEDRARKYAWYNAMDPGNGNEDRYRHIAAGLNIPRWELMTMQRSFRAEAGLPELHETQLLPAAPKATEKTAHAGPVELRSL